MSLKYNTPKLNMNSFATKVILIIVSILIGVILFIGIKDANTTVYKDNHLKVNYESSSLTIKNSNEVPINIIIINDNHKVELNVDAKSKQTGIELMNGNNKVFISCEYFEDNFEISKNI